MYARGRACYNEPTISTLQYKYVILSRAYPFTSIDMLYGHYNSSCLNHLITRLYNIVIDNLLVFHSAGTRWEGGLVRDGMGSLVHNGMENLVHDGIGSLVHDGRGSMVHNAKGSRVHNGKVRHGIGSLVHRVVIGVIGYENHCQAGISLIHTCCYNTSQSTLNQSPHTFAKALQEQRMH